MPLQGSKRFDAYDDIHRSRLAFHRLECIQRAVFLYSFLCLRLLSRRCKFPLSLAHESAKGGWLKQAQQLFESFASMLQTFRIPIKRVGIYCSPTVGAFVFREDLVRWSFLSLKIVHCAAVESCLVRFYLLKNFFHVELRHG